MGMDGGLIEGAAFRAPSAFRSNPGGHAFSSVDGAPARSILPADGQLERHALDMAREGRPWQRR